MNSYERHELRYLRRKEKRDKINYERSLKYANLDNAFCFHKVMYYADKCCKNVGFKKSTINFKIHLFTNISKCCRKIKNGNYNVGKTYKFTINERGKIRHIDAPHITDRLVHKVLSNEILVPIYNPHLIYDNGASMKDKEFKFSLDRVKTKMYNYYNKYGLVGYVVLIDFSNFFANCDHDVIHNIHKKYIHDDSVIKVIEHYLFIGEGIGLGIEIAQREACIMPNKLDHFLQNYGFKPNRYMDDTFCLVKTYDLAKNILEEYYGICDNLKIKINKFKTKIIKLNNYFKYCKWLFNIDNNGKIIRVSYKDTIYRQRRKLKKMYYLNIPKEELNTVRNSFIAYLNLGNNFKYINNLNKKTLLNSL